MSETTLKAFFDSSFESSYNNKLLERKYVLPKEEIVEYMREIASIPLTEFTAFMESHYNITYLTADDIIQFSKLSDATTSFCEKMIAHGDEGFSALEVGKILEDDEKRRDDGAYTKYGENHAKTACQLGYAFALSGHYFVSCTGYVLNDLPEKTITAYTARTIIRTRFTQRIVHRIVTSGKADYYNETGLLKFSTAERRGSNYKALVNTMKEGFSDKAFFSSITFEKTMHPQYEDAQQKKMKRKVLLD